MHVRLAPETLARRLGVALVAGCLLLACGPRDRADEVTVEWALEPVPPATGVDTIARITMRDEQRRPLSGARLQLEAHMSHPGMAPVIGDLTERGDGVYEAHLRFSMAGDWVLVVAGDLPDGRRIMRQLEVAGVHPAE